jgi:hypothetical protein
VVTLAGATASLTDRRLSQWKLERVGWCGTMALAGPVTLDLTRDGDRVWGTVRNDTGATLYSPRLLVDGSERQLDDLAPGEQRAVDLHPSVGQVDEHALGNNLEREAQSLLGGGPQGIDGLRGDRAKAPDSASDRVADTGATLLAWVVIDQPALATGRFAGCGREARLLRVWATPRPPAGRSHVAVFGAFDSAPAGARPVPPAQRIAPPPPTGNGEQTREAWFRMPYPAGEARLVGVAAHLTGWRSPSAGRLLRLEPDESWREVASWGKAGPPEAIAVPDPGRGLMEGLLPLAVCGEALPPIGDGPRLSLDTTWER